MTIIGWRDNCKNRDLSKIKPFIQNNADIILNICERIMELLANMGALFPIHFYPQKNGLFFG
jgi:hypothetical protein